MLKSDNGPCYTSREFHDFLEFYKIHHITSSLHYPQSNGFAEALVGISKKLVEKSIKDGKTVELWPTRVQSETHSKKPSITSRSSYRMQAENFTSSDSIKCRKICGKFHD